MTSITLDLFSGKGRPVSSISVPVLTLGDYDTRLKVFVKNMRCEKHLFFKTHKVVCRQLFQTEEEEGFCFPSSTGTRTPLNFSNRFFFINNETRWNFMLVFEPEKYRKKIVFSKTSLKFTKDNGYPKGANDINFFSLSSNSISILVSEHGRIITTPDGHLCLQGIAVSLLQTSFNQGKSLFLQRKEIIFSPNSPLKGEGLGDINLPKFVKVNCFCKDRDFFYSMHFPVLTPEELKEKLKKNKESRLTKYGAKSLRYKHTSVTQLFPESKKASCSRFIIFPPGMEVNVPFGPSRAGELFFSYSAETLTPIFQVVFFPPLFEETQPLPRRNPKFGKNWHIASFKPSVIFCIGSKASTYSFSGTSLVACSPFEYKITGMKVEIIATKQGGYWGIFCSTEKETASSVGSLVPGPSGVRPHFHEPRKKIACLFPCSQPVATISVSTDRQGHQAQQEGSIRPVSGTPAVMHHPYAQGGVTPFNFGLYPYLPTVRFTGSFSTVSVPTDRQVQQVQQEGSICPVSETPAVMHHPNYNRWFFPLTHQAVSTVSVLTDRQVQQAQQAVSTVSVLTDRQVQQAQQAVSTVSVLTDRQVQQEQQEGIVRPVSETPAVMHHPNYNRWFFPLTHQAVSTVSVLTDRQGHQAQQEGIVRPVSETPAVMHHLNYNRWFFPLTHQAVSTVSVPLDRQGQQEQQAVSTVSVLTDRQVQQAQQEGIVRPVSGTPAVMHHPYVQDAQGGITPFNCGLYPYPPSARVTGSLLSEGQKQKAQQGGRSRPDRSFSPPSASAFRPFVMAFDPFAPEAPQQGVGRSQKANIKPPFAPKQQNVGLLQRKSVIVSLESVQQRPLWKPDDKQEQEENS